MQTDESSDQSSNHTPGLPGQTSPTAPPDAMEQAFWDDILQAATNHQLQSGQHRNLLCEILPGYLCFNVGPLKTKLQSSLKFPNTTAVQ